VVVLVRIRARGFLRQVEVAETTGNSRVLYRFDRPLNIYSGQTRLGATDTGPPCSDLWGCRDGSRHGVEHFNGGLLRWVIDLQTLILDREHCHFFC
jgi:hypothetical protein